MPKRPRVSRKAFAALWSANIDLKRRVKALRVERDNLLRVVGRKVVARG